MVTACPSKSADYAPVGLQSFIDWLGYEKVTLQTDQEKPIMAIMNRVKEMRNKPVLLRRSPKGSHQSQGKVEGKNNMIEGKIRAFGLILEERYGVEWNGEHRMVP